MVKEDNCNFKILLQEKFEENIAKCQQLFIPGRWNMKVYYSIFKISWNKANFSTPHRKVSQFSLNLLKFYYSLGNIWDDTGTNFLDCWASESIRHIQGLLETHLYPICTILRESSPSSNLKIQFSKMQRWVRTSRSLENNKFTTILKFLILPER